MEKTEDRKYRIYCFVPYNISDKQKGIQALHGAQKYDRRYEGSDILHEFIDNHMICIMLDGGTTNNSEDPLRRGSLNIIHDELWSHGVDHSIFYEPDLNDALTAVVFIADDRVWDFKTYPAFIKHMWKFSTIPAMFIADAAVMSYEELIGKYQSEYKSWVEFVGGEKNAFLKNLIDGKKLA